MDNAIFRTRYQSNPYTGKKRSGGKNKVSFKEKLGLQIAICLLILMFAGIIKNAGTNVTNSLSEKIGIALSADMDVKHLSSPIMDVLSGFLGQSRTSTGDADIINPLPVSSSQGTTDTNKKIEAVEPPSNKATVKDAQGVIANPTPSSAVKIKGIFITPAIGFLGTPFGDIVDQLTQKTKSHMGVDIEAPNGTEIKAAAGGIVLESAYEKTMGYYVKIEHSSGYNTIYAQCSQLIAKKGQNVNQGEVIAKVGSTGISVGNHLHFEVWKDGKAVNPLDYIKVSEK